MTLREMRDMIRFEAQIEGSDTMIGPIDKLINAVLKEQTKFRRYPELRINQAEIVATAANDPAFVLPTIFQNLVKDRVFFAENLTDGFDAAKQLYESDLWNGSAEGFPCKFQLVGSSITVWPQTGSISTSSGLFIDYYRTPITLVNDTDVFPIQQLEETVKAEVTARINRHSKTRLEREFQADAQRSFSRSRGGG